MEPDKRTKEELLQEIKELEKKVIKLESIKSIFRQAERELKVRQKAIDTAINAIVFSALDGDIFYANNSFVSMWGYDSLGDVLGKTVKELWHSKDEAKDAMREVLEKGSWVGTLRAARKDGSVFDVELSATLVKDDKGEPVCMMASFLDVTQRRRAEERIMKLNETLMSLGRDYGENIEKITKACGELLEGSCALYNKMEGGMLCSIGQWQTPEDYESIDKPHGHICYDVIEEFEKGEPYIVKELEKTPYFETDPNVAKYGLKTYAGCPVTYHGKNIGSLCVVFQENVELDETDKRIMGILAEVISREEERRVAEEGSIESEAKFKTIFNNTIDGIILADVESKKFVTGNKTMTEMLGYGLEEIRDLSVMDIHPKEDVSYVLEQFEKQAKKEIELAENIPVKRKDGSVFYADINSSPVTLGGRDYLLGVFRDTTQRRKAERKLSESEEKWRSLVENAGNIIMIIDRDGTIKFINRTVSGMAVKDVLGKKLFDYVEPEYYKTVKDSIDRVYRDGGNTDYELKGTGPDGSTAWYETKAGPIKHGNEVVGATMIVTDITKHKQAEEKIRNSEEQLKVLFDYAPDAYYLSDLKARFVDGNKMAEKIIGYSKKDLIGRNYLRFNLMIPRDIPRAVSNLAKSAMGRSTGPDEFTLKRKDGTLVPVEVSTYPVKISGRMLVLGIARDITKRKKTETVIKKAYRTTRDIIENAPFGIYVINQDGSINYVNPAMLEIGGTSYKRFMSINAASIK